MTQVSRRIPAPPDEVYRAFVDPDRLVRWLPPAPMRGVVHEFEPRVGGRFRLSLVYREADQGKGKTSADTDTFHGHFAELVEGRRVVQVIVFESEDAAFAGTMRVTWDLEPVGDETQVTVTCTDIPSGIRPPDNERGSALSLEQLARLLMGRAFDPRVGPRLEEAALDAALREGTALFDEGRHWHAHEAWEAAWHRAPDEERPFFRGLIHAAAALVHHAKGNAYGFDRQRGRMEACLAPYGEAHRGVDLAALRDALAALPPAGAPARYPRLGLSTLPS